MTRINHEARAARAWPILINAARERRTIGYKELCDAIGVHWRAAAHLLSPIQDYCVATDIPPLTILAVNRSGRPGGGFYAWRLDSFKEGLERVFSHAWHRENNPFEWAEGGETTASLVERLLKSPQDYSEVWSLIQNRGVAQRVFRKAVLPLCQRSCRLS